MGNGGQKIIIRIPVEWALCIQLNATKRKYSSHEEILRYAGSWCASARSNWGVIHEMYCQVIWKTPSAVLPSKAVKSAGDMSRRERKKGVRINAEENEKRASPRSPSAHPGHMSATVAVWVFLFAESVIWICCMSDNVTMSEVLSDPARMESIAPCRNWLLHHNRV